MNRHFFTADLHLNHKNICTYCPDTRPYANVASMNEAIIAGINEVVGPDDTLHILGDVALGPKGEQYDLIKRINGRKHLYLGNHDRKRTVYENEWPDLFASVVRDSYMVFNGKVFWLAHVPTCNDLDDRDLRRPEPTHAYDYELCGHVHANWKLREYKEQYTTRIRRVLNVGWDIWQRPITMGDIFDALDISRI